MRTDNLIGKRRVLLISVGILALLLAIWLISEGIPSSGKDGYVMVNGKWVPVGDTNTGQSDSSQPAESGPAGGDSEPATVPGATGAEDFQPDEDHPPGAETPDSTEPKETGAVLEVRDEDWWEDLSDPAAPEQPEDQPEQKPQELTIDDYALFNGQYVEDGRDELVEDVAAILVTNRSSRFLDLGTLTFDIDGKKATFVVTGLPPGRSAWVMEASRMTADHSSEFTYVSGVTSFRDQVITYTTKLTITTNGNMMTVRNNSDETLTNLVVYYRTVHTDGNFFGGITYLVSFGDLPPGTSVETLAGHFEDGSTEIVRISWQDE